MYQKYIGKFEVAKNLKVDKVSDRKILRIDHVSLAVRDPKKAVEFFTKILGATSQS